MDYERYKEIKAREEYYAEWDPEQLSNLSDEQQDLIYKRYVVKCAVFTRDNFKCKNENCITPDSPITLHHIKFQKNGGQDKLKNCATICHSCHKAYHRGKRSLTFDGMTYRIHQENEIDWKLIKAKSKEIRKQNPKFCGMKISWQMVCLLMRFLEIDWSKMEDDENDQ